MILSTEQRSQTCGAPKNLGVIFQKKNSPEQRSQMCGASKNLGVVFQEKNSLGQRSQTCGATRNNILASSRPPAQILQTVDQTSGQTTPV